MNAAEHELQYPWTAPPEAGRAALLRPGLYWLRMPLPFALDHINLWLLEDEIDGRSGWTAIDCGIADEPTRRAWESLFDGTFGGRPLLRVIATHFHPDHLGLAHWLVRGGERARWSATLWMTAAEYLIGRFLSTVGASGARDPAPQADFYRLHGVPADEARRRTEARGEQAYARMVPGLPPGYVRLCAGDAVQIGARRFRVIVGSGHAPEHACLVCEDERLLIAGDMVLPRISTNVSVYDVEPEGDPLSMYLEAIGRLAELPEDTLVLPSHGLPFFGLRTRVEQLRAHHRDRLEAVLQACATPRTAHEMVPVLFPRPLDRHQITFAFGEALAHLHRLRHAGLLRRRCGADGVLRFSRV